MLDSLWSMIKGAAMDWLFGASGDKKISQGRINEVFGFKGLERVGVKEAGAGDIAIITGIEALGRGNDLQKLREFVAEIVNLAQVNPQVVQSLNSSDLIKRIATSLGIEMEGLIKTEEELAAEQEAMQQQQQQQQMMQMAEKAVAPVAGNVSKAMTT